MVQTSNTKKFIAAVKKLKETGVVKSYAEIIRAIEWSKTTFSAVLNGKKNVPDYYYTKFNEVYHIADEPFLVNGNLDKFLGERIEIGAAREAAIRVLVVWIKEIRAEVFKQPFAEVSLKFDRLAEVELTQILDLQRRQQQDD